MKNYTIQFYNNYKFYKKVFFTEGSIDILPKVQVDWMKNLIYDNFDIKIILGWLFFECIISFKTKNNES